MKRIQRIISLLLAIVMTVSLFDAVIQTISTDEYVAYAANKFGEGTYTGGNVKDATGDGTWSSQRTGVRIYCVDPDGKLLTTVMDLINPSYYYGDKLYLICHGIRTEDNPQYMARIVPSGLSAYFYTSEGADTRVDGDYPIVSTDQIVSNGDLTHEGSHKVMRQITENPATYKEETVTSKVTKIVPSGGIVYSGFGDDLGNYMTGENQWKPQLAMMDGATGSGEVDNSEDTEAIPETVYEQLAELRNIMDSNFLIYKQQFDMGQISAAHLLTEIGRDGLKFVKAISSSNSYDDDIVAIFAKEVDDILKGYRAQLPEVGEKDTPDGKSDNKSDDKSNSKPNNEDDSKQSEDSKTERNSIQVKVSDSSGYSYTLSADSAQDSSYSVIDISDSEYYSSNDGYETIFNSKLAQSIMDLAFGAEDKGNENLKPIYADEQFTNLFKLRWWGTNPLRFLPGVEVKKYSDGDLDYIGTLAKYNAVLMMEPIFWDYLNKKGNTERSNFVFYGTPYNLGLVMQEQTSTGGFNDGNGKGGNIGVYTNKNVPWLMYTETDLEVGGFTIRAGSSCNPNSWLTNDQLADKTMGHSLHWYKFSVASGEPEIPTYDFYDKDPNPEPHPAPDPDPERGPIPKVDDENPIKTRTVNIVKTYQIERIDGTIEHVKTIARRHTPQTIKILNEPFYKAVEWFTSPTYYFEPETGEGDLEDIESELENLINNSPEAYFKNTIDPNPVIPDTEWDTMKNGVPNTDSALKTYEESELISVKENVFPPAIKIAEACNCEEKDTSDGEHGKHFHDTTLYVRLIMKEKIPETSTFDEPDNPPTGTPPYVPPHSSEDPKQPPEDITDPETDPALDPYSHHRIVKVYETKTIKSDGSEQWTTDYVGTTYPTNPIVYIEDEKQADGPGGINLSWKLTNWVYGDEFNGVKWNKTDYEVEASRINPEDTSWEPVIAGVSAKKSGTTVAKVDLTEGLETKSNPDEVVTLYVRLVRTLKEDRIPGQIIIQQSQISKTIHTNDSNIGGMFANYRFAMTVDFPPTHTTHFYHGCCQKKGHWESDGDDGSYWVWDHNCGKCHGHTCNMHMPGPNTDPDVNFIFDQTTDQDQLEIKLGVHNKTNPMVYGKGGSSGVSRGEAIQYPEKIKSLDAEPNIYRYTCDGNDSNGAEYVTILWRGTSKYKDIPTLAKFKQNDITKRYGSENYEVPDAMLSSVGSKANKISNRKRASTYWIGDLEFSFGLRGDSDITGNSACDDIQGEYDTKCVHKDFRDYYPIEDTKFVWGTPGVDDFKAGVAIRFYAGKIKGLQAAPFGGKTNTPLLEQNRGTHKELNVIQCKQQINFYPYIRMTYMVNSLKDAEKEEENTDTNGYKQDVRKDTYVLSEYESKVLPADAVILQWKKKGVEENLLLTSQQWSVHQKAVNGSAVWNGKNQVLPGGAIYQLSTPEGGWVTMNLTTYQTVIDQKARNEYLSTNLTGDEYTEAKVAQDHLDFINDAKEVLDNLKVVQWVNKNVGADTAWTKDFKAKPSEGIVKILDGIEISGIDLTGLRGGSKTTPNDDQKYYMRQQTQLSDYQNSKLSEWTKTIDSSQAIEEKSYEGDLDVFNMRHKTTVFKLFTDTSGNVYLAQMEKEYPANNTGMDSNEQDIKSILASMKDLNADTYAMGQTGGATVMKLCDKKVSGTIINSRLSGDAKDIDDATKFITNFVSALTRNTGDDPTAEWVDGPDETRWYNEAFDGAYLVRQSATFDVGFAFSSTRTSALDPALCPQNKGQSDLYTKAFLSQFCTDSQSDAAIAQGKKQNYLGTFKDTDITLPDMESMYVSKKFYVPNANVQDLN
jgi:hypothetical protein